MRETLVRWFIAIVSASAALALIRASMVMNYIAWRAQGGDETTSDVLGHVSLAVDAFKSVLPILIAWSWRRSHRSAAVIAAIFFSGCLTFSLCGALGLASSSRSQMTGNREAAQKRHVAAERELADVEKQIAELGTPRPRAVVEKLIDQKKQDRRWNASGQCETASTESMRSYCREIATLNTEVAASIAGKELRDRARELQKELNALLASGIRSKVDGQAELVARLLGLPVENIQTSLSVLVALLLEFGAAFGLFLAGLPLDTRPGAQMELIPPPTRRNALETKPTRFVREGGRLLIK